MVIGVVGDVRHNGLGGGLIPEMYMPVDQAANLAINFGTDAGYVEDATFTKLRELAFTLIAPESFKRVLGGRGATFTIAGRNLHTWTKYKGFDPESNSTPGGNFSTLDFLTLPPTRSWTARVNVSF